MRSVAKVNQPRAVAVIMAVLLPLWTPHSAGAFDVILDPKQVAQLLSEIAKLHEGSQKGGVKDEQLDALYEMGERVLDLAGLMTQDLESHGFSDPNLISLIDRRLREQGAIVKKFGAGYHYDLVAFQEYLRRAPAGPRAADCRFALAGFDEPGDDVAAIQQSLSVKQRFIRDYPKYESVSIIELLVAQQYNRLARLYSSHNRKDLSEQQRRLANEQYRRVIRLYPSSEEAETARAALAP